MQRTDLKHFNLLPMRWRNNGGWVYWLLPLLKLAINVRCLCYVPACPEHFRSRTARDGTKDIVLRWSRRRAMSERQRTFSNCTRFMAVARLLENGRGFMQLNFYQ